MRDEFLIDADRLGIVAPLTPTHPPPSEGEVPHRVGGEVERQRNGAGDRLIENKRLQTSMLSPFSMLSEKHGILVETAVRSARVTPIIIAAISAALALGCGARVAAVNVVAVLQDTAQRHSAFDGVGRMGGTAIIIMTDDRAILALTIAAGLQARIAKAFKLGEIRLHTCANALQLTLAWAFLHRPYMRPQRIEPRPWRRTGLRIVRYPTILKVGGASVAKRSIATLNGVLSPSSCIVFQA